MAISTIIGIFIYGSFLAKLGHTALSNFEFVFVSESMSLGSAKEYCRRFSGGSIANLVEYWKQGYTIEELNLNDCLPRNQEFWVKTKNGKNVCEREKKKVTCKNLGLLTKLFSEHPVLCERDLNAFDPLINPSIESVCISQSTTIPTTEELTPTTDSMTGYTNYSKIMEKEEKKHTGEIVGAIIGGAAVLVVAVIVLVVIIKRKKVQSLYRSSNNKREPVNLNVYDQVGTGNERSYDQLSQPFIRTNEYSEPKCTSETVLQDEMGYLVTNSSDNPEYIYIEGSEYTNMDAGTNQEGADKHSNQVYEDMQRRRSLILSKSKKCTQSDPNICQGNEGEDLYVNAFVQTSPAFKAECGVKESNLTPAVKNLQTKCKSEAELLKLGNDNKHSKDEEGAAQNGDVESNTLKIRGDKIKNIILQLQGTSDV